MTAKKIRTFENDADLIAAAKSGDRLRVLLALRDLLAERLQTSNADRDIASMSRRLMQTIEEIEELEKERAARSTSAAQHIQEMRSRIGLPKCKPKDDGE